MNSRPKQTRSFWPWEWPTLGAVSFRRCRLGGGTSQTAVNDQAGAKTQMAEIATAGVVALALLFLAPLISLMPEEPPWEPWSWWQRLA